MCDSQITTRAAARTDACVAHDKQRTKCWNSSPHNTRCKRRVAEARSPFTLSVTNSTVGCRAGWDEILPSWPRKAVYSRQKHCGERMKTKLQSSPPRPPYPPNYFSLVCEKCKEFNIFLSTDPRYPICLLWSLKSCKGIHPSILSPWSSRIIYNKIDLIFSWQKK